MNILSFTHFSNFINIQNNKKHSSPFLYSTNGLKQDTVSFSANIDINFKEIEELKQLESSEQYHLRQSEIIPICCKYFGFIKEDGEHIKLTGPYGQVIMIRNIDPVDVSCASEFIKALKRVDEYNGELIVFNQKTTQEEMDYWKEKVYSEKPLRDGNVYAKVLQKQKRISQARKNQMAQQLVNEEIRKLREKISLLNLSKKEENLAKLKGRFDTVKEDFKVHEYEKIVKDEVLDIEKLLRLKTKEIETVRNIENKLSQNKKLTKEEKNKIDKFAKEYDLSELEAKLDKIEDLFLVFLEQQPSLEIKKQKESLEEEINTIISNFKDKNTEVVERLRLILAQVESGNLNLTNEQKEKIKSDLRQHISKMEVMPAKLVTNKPISLSSESVEQLKDNIEKINSVVAKTEMLYAQIIDFYEREIFEVLGVKNINEMVDVVSGTVSPQISTQNAEMKKFQEKLATKLSPLPISGAIDKILQIVETNFEPDKFELIKTGNLSTQEFVDDLIKNICKSDDYLIIKGATKFAFLNYVYNLSSPQNDEIYNLNSKQVKELYNLVAKGQKEIEIQTENKSLKINLVNLPDLKEIEILFEKFNLKLKSLEQRDSDKIVSEVLQYMPSNISKKESKDARSMLLEDGCYYELLCDNDSENLIKILLQAFWRKYKNKTGKDFIADVLVNYQQKQEEKKFAIMHQLKLKSIEEVDWTL